MVEERERTFIPTLVLASETADEATRNP